MPNATPLDTIHTFISAISTKNEELMLSLIHPNATACIIRNGAPLHLTIHQLVENLTTSPSNFVQTTWGETEHLDGNYATVLLSFKTEQDGVLKHEGTSTYVLWKDEGKGKAWVITMMADIARAVVAK